MTQTSIPERSPETNRLVMRLEKLEPGEIVEYATLSEVIGKSVQGDGYSSLASARRIVERERGCVFGTVARVGVKRLRPDAVPSIAEQATNRVRRLTKRTRRRLERVAAAEPMSDETKAKTLAGASLMWMLSTLTSRKSVAKIEAAVTSGDRATLPVAKTLQLFGISKTD